MSAVGMMQTVMATQLAEAIQKDHALAFVELGPAVSALVREWSALLAQPQAPANELKEQLLGTQDGDQSP